MSSNGHSYQRSRTIQGQGQPAFSAASAAIPVIAVCVETTGTLAAEIQVGCRKSEQMAICVAESSRGSVHHHHHHDLKPLACHRHRQWVRSCSQKRKRAGIPYGLSTGQICQTRSWDSKRLLLLATEIRDLAASSPAHLHQLEHASVSASSTQYFLSPQGCFKWRASWHQPARLLVPVCQSLRVVSCSALRSSPRN